MKSVNKIAREIRKLACMESLNQPSTFQSGAHCALPGGTTIPSQKESWLRDGLAKNHPNGHLGSLKSRLSNVRISFLGYTKKLLNTHI